MVKCERATQSLRELRRTSQHKHGARRGAETSAENGFKSGRFRASARRLGIALDASAPMAEMDNPPEVMEHLFKIHEVLVLIKNNFFRYPVL